MRAERDRRERAQLGRRVVPGGVEQVVLGGEAARDILWVPDFVANAGGVVNIAVELEPEGYAIERAETRVRAVADTVRTVLDHADATGATPLTAAMEIAQRRVAEATTPTPA